MINLSGAVGQGRCSFPALCLMKYRHSMEAVIGMLFQLILELFTPVSKS